MADSCDIGILTVIKPEFDAALATLACLGTNEREKHKDGSVYFRGSISTERDHQYTYVLGVIATAGNYDSAAAATTMIERFHPKVLFLMGIAAGIEEKTRIGEVIISDRVLAYEGAAVVSDGSVVKIEPRPDLARISHSLAQDLATMPSNTEAVNRLFSAAGGRFPSVDATDLDFVEKHVSTKIVARLQTIASGEKLLRDPRFLRALRENLHGRIEAGEMEAAGIVEACRRASIPWLVFRGISDFGDSTKADKYHDLVTRRAAAVMCDFMLRGLDLGDPSIDLSSAYEENAAETEATLSRVETLSRQFFEPGSQSSFVNSVEAEETLVAFVSAAPAADGSPVECSRRYHLGHAYCGSMLRQLLDIHTKVAIMIIPSPAYYRWRDPHFNRLLLEVVSRWLRVTDYVIWPLVVTDFVYTAALTADAIRLMGWLGEMTPAMRTLDRGTTSALRHWQDGREDAATPARLIRPRLGSAGEMMTDDEVAAIAAVLALQPSWYSAEWFAKMAQSFGQPDGSISDKLLGAKSMTIIEASKNKAVWLALSGCCRAFGIGSFPQLLEFKTLPNSTLTGSMRSHEPRGIVPLWGDISGTMESMSDEYAAMAASQFGAGGADPRAAVERELRTFQSLFDQER